MHDTENKVVIYDIKNKNLFYKGRAIMQELLVYLVCVTDKDCSISMTIEGERTVALMEVVKESLFSPQLYRLTTAFCVVKYKTLKGS